MSVTQLRELEKKLNDAERIFAGLDAQETLPNVARVSRLVQLFERSMKTGLDLSPVWAAVRTAGMTVAEARIIALRAEMATLAQAVVDENTESP